MRAALSIFVLLVAVSFVITGCKSSEQKSDGPIEDVVEKTEEMHEETEAQVDIAAPPKLAAELWGLIHTEGYKEHWKMMPGKDAYSEVGDGKLVTTYINDIAFKAIEKGEAMPPGSIVVSENYNMEKTLESINVKSRIAGYDKAKGGWFSVTYGPNGRPMRYNKSREAL